MGVDSGGRLVLTAAKSLVTIALTVSCLFSAVGQVGAQVSDGSFAGLLPVYNASGEPYGETFARYLTATIFDALSREGWNCLLLNPGGLYSPLNESAALEHAKMAGVNWMIALILKPAHRDQRSDGKPDIEVEGRLVSVATGLLGRSLAVRHEVKRRHLDRGFDTGVWPYPSISRSASPSGVPVWHWSFAQSSRRLSKQPLGKAVLKTAANLRPALVDAFKDLRISPATVSRQATGPCDVEFRVQDTQKKWASRSYSVVVNGREESAGVRNGVLGLRAASGLLVFEVSVKDTPFELPTQAVYLANTSLDCTASTRALSLDIGAVGEALLVWR